MYVCDSQSLDASNDGVEGGLNIGSRAGGHDGLGLFMEQLGYILHRNTREGHDELMNIHKAGLERKRCHWGTQSLDSKQYFFYYGLFATM